MAKEDPQALAERLFTTFLAPLVLGGEMRPQKPFGGKNALAIGDGRAPFAQDLVSRAQLARVRVARRLVPIDRFEPAPTGHEWALAACLHDLVQAAHPGFDAVFRRSGPKRLLEVIDKTLERIPPPRHVGEALSRHSWFSRLFELTRTDVQVKWWTGSETFLGEDPPTRLTAWPELRRVQQLRTPRPLMDLPTSGAAVDLMRFSSVVDNILARTPLTDLATADRAAPLFVWRQESLALCATNAGRTVVLRALALLPDRAVDAALGRATRQLFAMNVPRALGLAIDLLRDRTLAAAEARIGKDRDPEPLALADQPEAAFAVSVGALAASHWIASTGGSFAAEERTLLLRVLQPAATSPVANEVRALMGG